MVIKNKPVKAQVRMQANVGSSLSKGNNGSNLDGASRETFAEMEQRMLYMQAQCKEAQAALGRKHEEVSKLVARAELAENKVEELRINLLEANDNIEKAKVQNNKICLKLKETMQESMNKTYIIKARTETESKLTKEGTKLIESLKKSIDTSNQINDTLIHAKENEQSLRNSTKTFYETFVKDLNNVREQLNEFKENHANSVNTIQENMNKSVEKQTTVMEHSSTKLHSFSEESKMKLKNAKIETKELKRIQSGMDLSKEFIKKWCGICWYTRRLWLYINYSTTFNTITRICELGGKVVVPACQKDHALVFN